MAEGNPQSILAALAEADSANRALLVEVLRSVGLTDAYAYGDITTLRHALVEAPIDLLIVGADLPGAFEFVRDVRHGRVGANPFATVIAVVTAERGAELVAALAAGSDEVVTRPLKDAQLMARLRRRGSRTPFVAVSDFVGPDRRARERPGSLARVAVPNALGDQLSGRNPSDADRHALVIELKRCRLAAHGFRLAMLCRLIVEGDTDHTATQIVPILADAAGLAADLGEPEVALVCRTMASRSSTADLPSLATILAEGLVPVLRPGLSAAEHNTAAARAASTYRSRARGPADHVLPFGREAADMPLDIPALSLRAIPKGGVLFHAGDPAEAAHVVTSGTLALYRDEEGVRRVLAKAIRGEMLGDLASADGAPYQSTVVALEDSTVAVFPRPLLESEAGRSDPVVAALLGCFQRSLEMAHELYSPRSRHIADSVAEMRTQVAAILAYVQSASASAGLNAEAGPVALSSTLGS